MWTLILFCLSSMLRNRYLVFDVETTGLLPRMQKNGPPISISEYPHILQLSFAVYDISQKKTIKQYDSYVKIAEDVVIPEEVTKLTGITREIVNEKGHPIQEVLESFYEMYVFCHGLVAHNMEFDEKMILVELERNREAIMKVAPYCFHTFNETFEQVHGIERFCTMKRGTDLCNIMVPSKLPNGKPRKKWPRLSELYQYLFPGENVEGFHNSMVDVLACLRCFMKMKFDYDDKNLL